MREVWPEPAGFGDCRRCAYVQNGTPERCYRCAASSLELPPRRGCTTCGLPLRRGTACGNPICGWEPEGRYFDRNHAIAMRTGVLEDAINRYKYDDKWGWAEVFARLLVGHLDRHRDLFDAFDLIVASPTFVDPEQGRGWDHTQRVIEHARAVAEDRWPFDSGEPPAIVKTRATPRMVGLSWRERYSVASGDLRDALHVPRPRRTRGKVILVFDDVFTDGQTLNEIARCLRIDGHARAVSGITLARQPWREAG